jgi:hypothetical protein
VSRFELPGSIPLCRRILSSLYILETGEPGLAGAISQALDRQVYVPGDFIIRKGEQNDSMYFIDKGYVDVLHKTTEAPITTLGPLSFFGEIALVSRIKRAVASVRACTDTESYRLRRDAYARLIINYPSFKEWIESVTRLRLTRSKEHRMSRPSGLRDNMGIQEIISDAENVDERRGSGIIGARCWANIATLGRQTSMNSMNAMSNVMKRANTSPADAKCGGNTFAHWACAVTEGLKQVRTTAGCASCRSHPHQFSTQSRTASSRDMAAGGDGNDNEATGALRSRLSSGTSGFSSFGRFSRTLSSRRIAHDPER